MRALKASAVPSGGVPAGEHLEPGPPYRPVDFLGAGRDGEAVGPPARHQRGTWIRESRSRVSWLMHAALWAAKAWSATGASAAARLASRSSSRSDETSCRAPDTQLEQLGELDRPERGVGGAQVVEDFGQVPVAAGPRGHQDQGADKTGVAQGELLGDGPAHGYAHHGRRNAGRRNAGRSTTGRRLEHLGAVVGHLRRRVRPRRLARAAHAPVVDQDAPPPPKRRRGRGRPRR